MMSVTSSYFFMQPFLSNKTIEDVVNVVCSLKNWCSPFS
jgi:hypothetical protein